LTILRWILVVLCPFVGFFLGSFIVGIWNFVFGAGETRWISYVIQPGFAGFASIALAGYVAPSNKMYACIYALIVLASVSGLAVISAIVDGNYGNIVIVVTALIGAAIGFHFVREDSDQF